MKLFRWFKKEKSMKNTNPGSGIQTGKDNRIPPHPFMERCAYLRDEYGLIVPDVYINFFTRHKISENNFRYRCLWDNEIYERVFYTKEFILYAVKRYTEIHGEQADYAHLQEILDEAHYEFILKENRFAAEHMDISFIDQCYEELERNQDCLMIGIETYADCGGAEYMIMTSDKKGYRAGGYHGMSEDLDINGITITYEILNYYGTVGDTIIKEHSSSRNNQSY